MAKILKQFAKAQKRSIKKNHCEQIKRNFAPHTNKALINVNDLEQTNWWETFQFSAETFLVSFIFLRHWHTGKKGKKTGASKNFQLFL